MKKNSVKLFATVMTVASLAYTPVMAADSSDYILLLPKTEGITYEMDQDHVAAQYSNDQYTVLLYKEGESVDVTVKGADSFLIQDAMGVDTTDYASEETEGKVSFSMPAEDLSLNIISVSDETENKSETPAETELQTETTNVQTEAADEDTASPAKTVSSADIKVVAAKASLKDSADFLTQGQRVRVLDEKDGWSHIQYVKEGSVAEGDVKTSDLTGLSSLYVTTANVNVRAEASDTSEKLGKVESGKEVIVSDSSQEKWSKVMFVSDGTIREAYMFTQYLQQETDPAVDELLVSFSAIE